MKELYLVKHQSSVRVFTEATSNILRYYPYGYTKFDDDCAMISCDQQMIEELKCEWRAFCNDPESYDKTPVAECVFQWCENRWMSVVCGLGR